MAQTSAPQPDADTGDLVGRCREAGIRLTHQRLAILEELDRAMDHPPAEVLHRRVRRAIPPLSLDTVYRTLALLEEHGLARRISGAGPGDRFDAGTRPMHHHLICRKCHAITDLPEDAVELPEMPEPVRRWGQPSEVQLIVRGICHTCQSSHSTNANQEEHQ